MQSMPSEATSSGGAAETQMQIKLSSQYNVAELAAIGTVISATLVAFDYNRSKGLIGDEAVGFYDMNLDAK